MTPKFHLLRRPRTDTLKTATVPEKGALPMNAIPRRVGRTNGHWMGLEAFHKSPANEEQRGRSPATTANLGRWLGTKVRPSRTGLRRTLGGTTDPQQAPADAPSDLSAATSMPVEPALHGRNPAPGGATRALDRQTDARLDGMPGALPSAPQPAGISTLARRGASATRTGDSGETASERVQAQVMQSVIGAAFTKSHAARGLLNGHGADAARRGLPTPPLLRAAMRAPVLSTLGPRTAASFVRAARRAPDRSGQPAIDPVRDRVDVGAVDTGRGAASRPVDDSVSRTGPMLTAQMPLRVSPSLRQLPSPPSLLSMPVIPSRALELLRDGLSHPRRGAPTASGPLASRPGVANAGAPIDTPRHTIDGETTEASDPGDRID